MRKARFFIAAVAAVALAACQAHAVDPVVYLPFEGDFTNQGTGGSLYDGFLVQGGTGSYAFAAGPTGQGQCLDINNDGALKTDGTFLAVDYTLPDQGTIALWYYAEPWYNYQTIYDNATGSAEYWEMWIYNDGRLRTRPNNSHPVYGYDGSHVTTSLSTAGGPGNWYHIAYSWDRYDETNQATKLYLDGRLVDFNYCAWADPGPSFYLASGHAGNTYGNGAWDELRIYDAVLDVGTIAELAGVDPVEPPTLPRPLIHYGFEGNVANKGTGGSTYDGVLNLGTTGSAGYVEGTAGQGIEFGNSDPARNNGAYVTVPYKLPEEGTISLMFKGSEWYNYLTLFDNAVDGNQWESWVYSNGNIRTRITNGQGDIPQFSLNTFDGGLDQWLHICYAWSLDEGIASMYVNGKFIGSGAISSQEWITPGDELYIAGGHPANNSGLGVFDEFKIFESMFSLEQAALLYSLEMEGGVPGGDLAGDLNGDGMVGSADLDIVRANWGQTVEAGCVSCGDPSGDGVVGSADLDIVRANWGNTAAAAVVPEPGFLVLLTAVAVLGLLRRK